jgi:putative transcriptional regulator
MSDDNQDRVGESILRGLQDAVAFQRGEPSGVRVHRFELIYPDVRELRKELGLTQHQFAAEYGFSLSAVRHWEQGKRIPEKAARILLMLIAKQPGLVRQTLRDSVRRIAAE